MLKRIKSNRGYSNKFHPGDIVYWVEKDFSGKFEVKWGRIDECYCDGAYVDFLEPKENRYIKPLHCKDWIYLPDFESETSYHKLPKGWSYDTRLYEVERRPIGTDVNYFYFDIRNSKLIKYYYNKGYLVKSSSIYHGNIESEVTKEGYRIVLKYPMWEHHREYIRLHYFEMHGNYAGAEKELQERLAEVRRQCALTDEEWSIEQMDKTLYRYANLQGLTKEDPLIIRIREYFMKHNGDIAELETRLTHKGVEYKYFRDKKWKVVHEELLFKEVI